MLDWFLHRNVNLASKQFLMSEKIVIQSEKKNSCVDLFKVPHLELEIRPSVNEWKTNGLGGKDFITDQSSLGFPLELDIPFYF